MSGLHQRLLDGGALQRVIGHVRGVAPGPMLIVVAGIHGNEPASVLAARRVLAHLAALEIELRGDLVLLAGNITALERDVRGVSRDLNRGWTREKIAALPVAAARATAEDLEQRRLFDAIETARAGARGEITFLDLHSTSAPGIPFAMARDLEAPLAFAQRFPLPVIVGLLELVDATLLEFMRGEGCMTLGVEAGHNDAESSIDHHEAVLWLALEAVGLAAADSLPQLERHRQALSDARGSLPHVMRIEHRHAIAPRDQFRMLPGFANIERVRAGQLLAHDRNGEIRAPRAGILLLPLYQAQGDDGFFLGAAVEARFPAASPAAV